MDTAFAFYDTLLDLIPDGILAADRDLRLRTVNRAACRLLGLSETEAPLGAPADRVLGDAAFLRLRDGERSRFSDTFELAGKDILMERLFLRDEEGTVLLCVLRDVTADAARREHALQGSLRAAELADAVCEKQLAAVREIAGLLGESAVETQAALQELKRTLLPDKEDRHD